MADKTRDAWLDNAKAILVTLVVFGHFIASGVSRVPALAFLSNFIYSFHMPAFLFVSGYLCKCRIEEKSVSKVAKTVLLPYALSQIFIFAFASVFPDGVRALSAEVLESGFSLFYPVYHLWYFVAVAIGFLFCVAVNSPKRRVLALSLSVVVSILAGLIQNADFLRLTKCFGYLPFFVFGAVFSPKTLEFINKKKILSVVGVLCFACVSAFFWAIRESGSVATILAMTGKYGCFFEKGVLLELLLRLATLLVGALLSLSFLAACPRKKRFFTFIGERSAYVFVLHALLLAVLRHINYSVKFIPQINTFPRILGFAVFAVLCSALLASKPVRLCFRWLLEPSDLFKKR